MGKSIFILGQSRKQSTKMAETNGSGLINESFRFVRRYPRDRWSGTLARRQGAEIAQITGTG
jgi:hypothetical protein